MKSQEVPYVCHALPGIGSTFSLFIDVKPFDFRNTVFPRFYFTNHCLSTKVRNREDMGGASRKETGLYGTENELLPCAGTESLLSCLEGLASGARRESEPSERMLPNEALADLFRDLSKQNRQLLEDLQMPFSA
jgi:hypothetical protein